MSRNACPLCGHDDPPPEKVLTRGLLSVSVRDPKLYWRGLRIPKVEPMMARMMIPLIRSGQAHRTSLSLLTNESATINAVSVYISKLRKAFREEGLPVRISKPRYGECYSLVLDEADNQNTQQIAGGRG